MNSSALIGGKFNLKKSFTRFALQHKCCNFNQWEDSIYNRSHTGLYLNLTYDNHQVLIITFIKVTVWLWFHFQCILCWLIVFQQFYFTQLPFISNQETSAEFNSNWISKCICSSSMAWIELPNLNSFSHVLKFRYSEKATKFEKNLPPFFEITYLVMSKQSGRFKKNWLPSQNIWTLLPSQSFLKRVKAINSCIGGFCSIAGSLNFYYLIIGYYSELQKKKSA